VGALVAVALSVAVGCADDAPSSAGEAIGGGSAAAGAPGSARSAPSIAAETSGPAPGHKAAAKQVVDLATFGDAPQARAVAEFYEQLWTSYHRGEVTDRLTRLAAPSALEVFRDRVRDYRRTGHTVADLTDASIVEVDGDIVFVCMASSSYQRLEARTGAAVNPPESGHTQYVVRLQRNRAPWRVDTINGTENSPCGEEAP